MKFLLWRINCNFSTVQIISICLFLNKELKLYYAIHHNKLTIISFNIFMVMWLCVVTWILLFNFVPHISLKPSFEQNFNNLDSNRHLQLKFLTGQIKGCLSLKISKCNKLSGIVSLRKEVKLVETSRRFVTQWNSYFLFLGLKQES